ncbi:MULTISPECIES: gas vesicle protein GvpG [Streptomyces]|uniref:Gas vesicle protein n=1 Tax=Streptomyces monashensis TaxID=1678012 RepID=A0A1S2PRK0_9ACTN|nr:MULTISPECIES: gas vesicle protein GvpG [Streptomyces]OIJ86076.1 gas vesicle protein [Streptomyces sp. MUSC 14]OIJ96373.1 gas vesicle protein [Streptomyces monashensis]
MGLLSQLLTFPLAPVRGVGWVVDRVIEAAEREYYDPEPVERELAALERALLEGRIDQKTFDEHEDRLLDRLEEITAYWRGDPAP